MMSPGLLRRCLSTSLIGRRGAKSAAEKGTMADASTDVESTGDDSEEDSREAPGRPALTGPTPSPARPLNGHEATPQRKRDLH